MSFDGGGKGNSDSQANQTTNLTDQRIVASEGSNVFSHDASGNIVNDPSIFKNVGDVLQKVSGDNTSVAIRAIDSGESVSLEGLKRAQSTIEQANGVLERVSQTYAQNLARNAGDAPQTVTQDLIKWGAVAALGIGAFLFLKK